VSQQPPPPPGPGGPWPGQGPQRPPRPQPGSPRPAGPSGSHGPRKLPPPGDRPTQFIPKIDETTYIPKVPGGRSNGRPAYPEPDPNGFTAVRGTFQDLGIDEPDTVINPPVDVPFADEDDLTGEQFLDTGEIADRPPVRTRETGRTAVRTIGEVLITAGMVVLLFVVYELYVTNIFSAQKQANATSALNKEWDTVTGPQRTDHFVPADGQGIAKIYIPALGHDWHFTVIEGTTQPDLAIGPGHYPGTAMPGQPGDMAIAGHRVGEGAPFDALNVVQSCDAIVIETQSDWYVYRLLPMANEAASWATGRGKTTQCAGPNGEGKVQPLTGLYTKTVGQEIVLPTEGDVVAPVPHYPGAQLSAGQEVSLLTLTTCNPKFSAAQRMILHAVLVKDWKKDTANPNQTPPELKETT
jgi:sortase A